jgi:hypothetical protein
VRDAFESVVSLIEAAERKQNAASWVERYKQRLAVSEAVATAAAAS